MARINKRLVGPVSVPSPGNAVVYTAPANTRATITRVHIVSQASATTDQFVMSIGAPATSTVLFVAGNGSQVPGLGGTFDWYGPVTLNPGESLYMGSASSNFVVVINGYEENT